MLSPAQCRSSPVSQPHPACWRLEYLGYHPCVRRNRASLDMQRKPGQHFAPSHSGTGLWLAGPSQDCSPSPFSCLAEGVGTGCSAPGNFLNKGSRLPQDRLCFCLGVLPSQGVEEP